MFARWLLLTSDKRVDVRRALSSTLFFCATPSSYATGTTAVPFGDDEKWSRVAIVAAWTVATTVMAFRRRRLGRNGLLEGPLISNPLLIFGPGTLSWQRASNRDDGLDVLRPSSSISVPGTFWWSSFFCRAVCSRRIRRIWLGSGWALNSSSQTRHKRS